ncbi:hypothetical protein U6A24_16605 [Aquimarina gracilis]|uniref:Cytochrome B n=1 Tax=Aquimarina gracilis TaxID=874422 RepID=A0ABU5ZZ19_9FLAO|nr:hypothetical protein [Aquimarina gracilis]MEB3347096.1 hypothetical protein [Aquimarina gracilis]
MNMYDTVLVLHSIFKWLVLLALSVSVLKSYLGYGNDHIFNSLSNGLRHWTATIAHIQLVLGIVLYSKSPVIKYFWNNFDEASENLSSTFFGLIHIILMLLAIIIITIGSAKAKREQLDKDKFKTMALWFTVGLLIIFIAIPWPFSPLANRPYVRTF